MPNAKSAITTENEQRCRKSVNQQWTGMWRTGYSDLISHHEHILPDGYVLFCFLHMHDAINHIAMKATGIKLITQGTIAKLRRAGTTALLQSQSETI